MNYDTPELTDGYKVNHKPSGFVPEDYEAIEEWDLKLHRPQFVAIPYITIEASRQVWEEAMKAWRAEIARMKTAFGNGSVCDPVTLRGGRWPHVCDHCGNVTVRYAWSVLHKPTNEVICIGHECVENKLGLSISAFRMKYIKDRAAREADLAKKAAKLAAWREANPEAAKFMESLDPDTEKFEFLQSLMDYLIKNWELTPGQTAAALKIAAKRAQQSAERAEREATEVVPATPAPEGRVTVTGKVVHTKTVESDFGATMKMLVVLEDGNKVWTTIPSKLFSVSNEPVKGATIKLTATFERSKDDEHFSFGKRPSAERI